MDRLFERILLVTLLIVGVAVLALTWNIIKPTISSRALTQMRGLVNNQGQAITTLRQVDTTLQAKDSAHDAKIEVLELKQNAPKTP